MHSIENETLKITISDKGAELKTIFNKITGLDYMWGGDAAYWGKTSPVLFPIVGTLKNNAYHYNKNTYALSRHGFARDKFFEISAQTKTSISFTLKSDEETLTAYPFSFVFTINYSIENDMLRVEYHVENPGETQLPFSVGGHPAFKLPLITGTNYDDYQLIFEKEETAGRWPITTEGLLKTKPESFLAASDTIQLSKKLFEKDAIVLKHLQSGWVKLASAKTPHGLTFNFEDFGYLGLWAVPGADFICIEPWCGVADSENASGNILEKEGIISLPPGKIFTAGWQASFY